MHSSEELWNQHHLADLRQLHFAVTHVWRQFCCWLLPVRLPNNRQSALLLHWNKTVSFVQRSCSQFILFNNLISLKQWYVWKPNCSGCNFFWKSENLTIKYRTQFNLTQCNFFVCETALLQTNYLNMKKWKNTILQEFPKDFKISMNKNVVNGWAISLSNCNFIQQAWRRTNKNLD